MGEEFKQYGLYETFHHEPTEEEVDQAIQRMMLRAVQERGKDIVILNHFPAMGGMPERWTVALKFVLGAFRRRKRTTGGTQ